MISNKPDATLDAGLFQSIADQSTDVISPTTIERS